MFDIAQEFQHYIGWVGGWAEANSEKDNSAFSNSVFKIQIIHARNYEEPPNVFSKHILENSSNKSIPFWPEQRTIYGLSRDLYMSLSVTQVVNGLLRSNVFYCPFDQSGVAIAGAADGANIRRMEDVTVSMFISPLLLYALDPTTHTHGHFVLSPVSLASTHQDGGQSNSLKDIYDLTEK